MKSKIKIQAGAIAGPGRMAGAALVGLAMLSASSAPQAADTIKGKQLYTAHCAICHGASGKSVMPGTPNLDQGDRMLRPDFTLLAAIRTGKNAMPAYQGILSDRDIMDVIAFMRTLH